jgi:hypothetical protein
MRKRPWDHHKNLVIGFEVGLTDQVDSFVHAIGQQEFLRPNSEVIRGNGLHWFPFRISRKVFDSDITNSFEHSRRATDRVFVEIEPQAVAPAQRRVVRR